MKTVTIGEIMLRLSPTGYRRLSQAEQLEVHYGGAEANVALSLSVLGDETRFVTMLPKNALGEGALRFIRAFGVDTSCILRGGEKLGVYFLEAGASQRGGSVIYDRAGSAFARSALEDYNFDCIFAGADRLHITGITPALGEACARLTETAMREAKRRHITVSFDPNYRRSLWTEEEAAACFQRLLPLTDILFASTDGLSVLGLTPVHEDSEKAADAAQRLRERYALRAVALTMRGHISASENRLSAVYDDGTTHFAKTYSVQIVDRVGGGDAFAAGLLYALGQGYDGQTVVEFATAASVLKHTIPGAVNLATADEILSLLNDRSGSVKR